MRSTFEFCLPTKSEAVPTGPDWLHEVKYDGYRLRLERDGSRVRLISRGGYNWADRYPWIVEAALKNQHRQFVIDGEAVVLGVDGVADFDALHSRRHDHEVQLYAFDCLALDGEDLRGLPLSMRKTNLARLLARRPDGIFVAPFEQGEIGPDLFRAACRLGLEGLVSKRRDRPYQTGRSKYWIKVKNRNHPAMSRVMDAFS
jgi:bifunctional non-homologous end joining protein LigD